jgi:hypothetical protein
MRGQDRVAQALYEAFQAACYQAGGLVMTPTLTWVQLPEHYKNAWRNFVPRAKYIYADQPPQPH